MNSQNDYGMKSSIEALNQQLAMNLLLQQPTIFGQGNPNLNQLSMLLNQGSLMQMAQLNNTTSLLMNSQNSPSQINNIMSIPQVLWMLNQNFHSTRNIQNQVSQPAFNFKVQEDLNHSRMEKITTISQESLLMQPNFEIGIQNFEKPALTQNIMKPIARVKSVDETILYTDANSNLKVLKQEDERKSSFSTDLCTQDAEKAVNDSSKTIEFEIATSLVFNIRRYNKKQKKYILLTRHRKLITKCKHSDGEYYAKGMCKKCYHNKGERGKYAYSCGHNEDFHYARGLCKKCYLTEYHNNRKAQLPK